MGGGGAESLGLQGVGDRQGVPTQSPKDPGAPVPSLGRGGAGNETCRTESETTQVELLEGRKGALLHLVREGRKENWGGDWG